MTVVYDPHQWVIKEIQEATMTWVCLDCGETDQVPRYCKKAKR
jgi:hypothetical protein